MLIKNHKINLFKNFILFLLVLNLSASSFIVQQINKDNCCHEKKEEVKEMSCCKMMGAETGDEKCVSPVLSFEKNFSDCGCIHNFNPTGQNIQIVKTQELTKVKVYADISYGWNYQQVTPEFANTSFEFNTESPPIYLTVSSFLI